MKDIRIAVTGVTGLIGRNIFYEYIRQNIADLGKLHVFLLGREQGGVSFRARVMADLLVDGADYCGIAHGARELEDFAGKRVHFIEMDLYFDGIGIAAQDLALLRSQRIDHFFHSAASTDLRDSDAVQAYVKRVNSDGTGKLLGLVEGMDVREFCYVSTAYACGIASGHIGPDDTDFKREFRNPYELAKLKSEKMVRDFSLKTGRRIRIFRPSSVCGRLIEPPLGTINKFDVFYSWGAFFLALKMKEVTDRERIFETPFDVNTRVFSNPHAGLNIVPVDYVAKAVYQICTQDCPGNGFNLTSPAETPHQFYLDEMLRHLNITGVHHVDRVPVKKNARENFYYRTMGRIFNPYVAGLPMLFDTSNYAPAMARAGIVCPPIDKANFGLLMAYAKKKFFGLIPS